MTVQAEKSITINDVARIAEVSKKTVSRVINDDPNVGKKTRQHVQTVIQQLGYAPNRHARSLAARRSFLLGLVYDNPNAGYVVDALQGALEAAHTKGYEIITHPCNYAAPDLIDTIARFVDQSRVDGIIVLPPVSEREDFVRALIERKIKAVRIAGTDDAIAMPQVLYNDAQAIYRITQHLLRQGHQRIGFIGGHKSYSSSHRRYQGFVSALQDAGIDHDDGLTIWGEYTFESGQQAANDLLTRTPRPTALLCSNDAMAAGALRVAHELKLPVPDALSITGFDDAPLATQVWPPLTTMRQPVKMMAGAAAQSLIDLVENRPVAANIDVSCELMRRASTSDAD